MTREEAIKTLYEYRHCLWDKLYEPICMAIKALEQEQKTGYWILTYGGVKCSVCGSVKDGRNVGKATHYCDFCGAKMIEQKERNSE